MRAFDDVPLEWSGKTYVIPSNAVLRTIAAIEDVVTLDELQGFARRGTAPMAKLAMAWGSVLRHGGARVTDDEVYEGMFSGETLKQSAAATTALLYMMIPKNIRPQASAAKASKKKAAGSNSSKKRTKRLSQPAVS